MRTTILFLCEILLAAHLLGAHPLGLLDQPQTFPWTVGLTPVVQEESGGLGLGEFRLRSSVLWFNTYRQYGTQPNIHQQVDMEGLVGTVSGAWSFAPHWEMRSQVQGWLLGGGVLDAFLGGFHGFLGVPNQGRNETTDGGYRNFLKGRFDDRQPAWGLTQASMGVRGFVGPWSWTAWGKLPVNGHVGWWGPDLWGGGSGVGWGDHWTWAEAGLTFGAGLTGALVFSEAWTGQGGFYAIVEASGPRALIQGSWTAVPQNGPGYLSQGAGLLTLGFQVPVGSTWVWELALTEEFLTWATMEVGFQAGLVGLF